MMNLKGIKVVFGVMALLFSQIAFANTCTNAFPGGLNNNSSGSSISFNNCGSQLLNNPNSVLWTHTVNNNFGDGDSDDCTFPNNDPDDCHTAPCPPGCCTASGTAVATISPGSFQAESGGSTLTVSANGSSTAGGTHNTTQNYSTITVGSSTGGATLTFSAASSGTTTYKISTLKIYGKNSHNSVINLPAGDYWINTLSFAGSAGTVTFNVTGTGTARIYLNSSTNINSGQTMNWNTGSGTSAASLLIYNYGSGNSFTINDSNGGTAINALIYGQGAINLTGVALSGAVTGANIAINANTTVTYDSTAVSSMDFGANFGSGCQASAATKFVVTAPSTGTNCQNMTVTVTAQNASSQTVTNYTGAITLTTQNSSGTWVSTTGGGSFTGGSSGTATYQFVAGDNGTATFQLSYPNTGASPMTIEAYQTNTSSINGYSGAINFIPAGLLVTGTAVSNPPASPPAAFSTTESAGNNFTLYLTAYNTGSCGIVSSYTGTKTIRFYTTYVNPTTGTVNMTINGTNIASSSSATATTQSITFTNGAATVTGNYKDAGMLSLNVIDTSTGGPTGASGNFIVVPAQFAINLPGNSATQTASPSSAAVTACLADSAFSKAGDAFTVNVQAQTAQGVVTPNFGNETSPEGVSLTSGALLAPAGGRNGSTNAGVIANGSTFTKVNGSGSPFTGRYFTGTTFSFDEVGCINLVAGIASGNYLAAGGNVTVSQVVGRFTPDHFSAAGNTPEFTTVNINSNGSFTYLGQGFNYLTVPVLTVTANAAAGTTTQNYTGSFWKLSSSTFAPVYNEGYYAVVAGDSIPALTFVGTVPTPVFVDNGNGTGTYTYSGGSALQIQKPASPSPQLTAEIQLNIATIKDSDNVACTGTGCVSNGYPFGLTTSGNGILFSGTGTGNGKQFLYGRLAVVDANGLESASLTMPMQTQYYTDKGFVLNTYDSTTSFTGGVSSLVITPSTGLSTTATLPAPPTFVNGVLNISFSAPNISGNASVEANLTSGGANLIWLEYPWPSSTNNCPVGQAVFGVSQGNPRIIYSKENVP